MTSTRLQTININLDKEMAVGWTNDGYCWRAEHFALHWCPLLTNCCSLGADSSFQLLEGTYMIFFKHEALWIYFSSLNTYFRGPSWSWSYGSWIYNYPCNQCLSLLKL